MWRLALALLPAVGFADDEIIGTEVIEPERSAETIDTMDTTSTFVARTPKGTLILPDGHEFGAELGVITWGEPYGARQLDLTDVGLLTIRGRTALGHYTDVFFSTKFLPKQPEAAASRFFQSATVGLDTQPWRKPFALWTKLEGGTLIDDKGTWGQVAGGVEARKKLHKIVSLEGNLSAAGTQLYTNPASSWFVEAAVKGAILFRDPEGWTGGWYGFGYSYPVAHAGATFDPDPRLDLEIGIVFSFIDNWDITMRYVAIDRGDAKNMSTQLPILDGGFDQRQLILGIAYHTRK